MRVCFDYGHGGKDSGACYMDRRESREVLSIGQEVAKQVRQHGIIVDETRTSDRAVSLGERCQFERKKNYDYFISFHRNAYKPEVANGVEVYTYLNGGPKAHNLATNIQNSLVVLGFKNRGIKRANFYVLRETRAPAVLVEIGFIDHSGDNRLLDLKRKEIVETVAQAIVETCLN